MANAIPLNNAAVHEETLRRFLQNPEMFKMMDSETDRRFTLSPKFKLIVIDIIENVWQRVQSGISRGSLSPLLILVLDKYKVILPDSVGHLPEYPYFVGFEPVVSFLTTNISNLKCTYLEPIMEHFKTLYTNARDTGNYSKLRLLALHPLLMNSSQRFYFPIVILVHFKYRRKINDIFWKEGYRNSVSRKIDIWDTIKDIPECVLVHDYCDQYHEKKDYNKGATSELEYARNYSTHINQLAQPAKEQKKVERFLAEKFPDLLTSLFEYCFKNNIKLDFLLQWSYPYCK